MKNIQIIDGAINCVYDIFAATDEEFAAIFPEGTDIAFIDEVYARENPEKLDGIFSELWRRPVPKDQAMGIHGILFHELNEKCNSIPPARIKRLLIQMEAD